MRDCFMRFDRLKWTIGLFLLRVPNINYEKSIIENCKKLYGLLHFNFTFESHQPYIHQIIESHQENKQKKQTTK